MHMPPRAAQRGEICEPQSRVAEVVVLPAEMGEDMLSRFHNHCTPLYGGCVFSVPLPRTGAAAEQGAIEASVPTVLVTSRPPRYRIDYVDQLVGDDSEGRAPGGVALEFRTDPFRVHGVDVIHLTDISTVFGDHPGHDRERTRRAKRFVRLLRRRRIALVRTVHGEEASRGTSRAAAIVDEAATTVISLYPAAAADGRQTHVVGHSHLRDRFLGFPQEQSVAGRVLITAVSTLHPSYRAVLSVFGVAELPDWTLRIAGKVPVELEESYARTLADHTDAMALRNELLSDAACVSEVSQAEVVLVTAPETYESMSILMLALSLDRPVLVEDTAQTRSLADEVGSSWVRRHTGPVTAQALETALAALRQDPPTGRPNLDSRAPNVVSEQYHDVYRAAAAAR